MMSVTKVKLSTPVTPDVVSLYRSIFERASDAIAIIAPDGTYVEQNEAHVRLLGWGHDELRGRTPAIHLGEEAFAQMWRRLAADGYFFGTVESRDRTGHVRKVELSAFPVTDEHGGISAYIGVKRDITRRLAAEQELRRRYEQLQAIHRLTTALASATQLEAIFREGLACACDAFGARRASILLRDPDGVMRFRAWTGLSDGYRAAVEGYSPWSADDPSPQPIVVAEVRSARAVRALADAAVAEGIGALAFVPLVAARRLLGTFMVYFDEPRTLRDEELQLAKTIGDHIAFAIMRRRAQEALARREREFEALAEHAPDIIVRFDRALRHLYVNPAIATFTGLPQAAFIGRTHEEVGMPAELAARWRTLLHGVFDSGEPADLEFTYRTPAGPRYFQARVTPEVIEDGVVQTVLSTTRDITDLKRAEARLRLLAEIGGEIVARLDYRDGLMAVAEIIVRSPFADACAIDLAGPNGTLERLTAVSKNPRHAALLRELEAQAPATRIALVGHATALHTGCAQLYPEITDEVLRAISGSAEHLALWRALDMRSLICAPLLARGRTIGVISLVSHDELRPFSEADLAFAEELAGRLAVAVDNLRLLEEATAASRIKSDFMATMSHELRTPLNAIMGYTELLDLQIAGPITPRQHEQIERIRASTDHLLTVIEQILTFSRVEAGRENLCVERLDAVDLASECASMIEPIARRKGLAFTMELPPSGMPVVTDAVKLRQVLLNILSNAVKFTDSGGVSLHLRANTRYVAFDVEDTGIGISQEHRERIFEPFWQVHGGTKRRSGGTGLGLTVSRQLMSLLGGELKVHSEVGRGSRFSIRVPTAGTGVSRRARASTHGTH
jgi:PAS domain S-box-containing protein